MNALETLDSLLLDVPDFPKPGIIFKDITPVLADARALKTLIVAMAEPWRGAGITQVIGVEARGFIFGTALALELGVGLTLVRKPGKLPRETAKETYALEYGTDTLEMHADALGPDDRVLIVDDVLATGGTAEATVKLIRGQGRGATIVGAGFLMELGFLSGRERLDGVKVHAIKTL